MNSSSPASASSALFTRALAVTPGGVHSPVRSFKGLPQSPVFFEKAQGAYFTAAGSGKSYMDFCMSFGPLILGHTHPQVHAALEEALGRGWSYGACERYSLELAEFLVERLPFIEQVRFVNSGTEAVMTALRLARGYTKRDKILKFDGCYHGHVDSMLIKSGSGLAGVAESSSAGVPAGVAQDTLIAELDNLEAVEAIFRIHGEQIAAVIIEPLPANYGLLEQRPSFLQALREITQKYGALLIFDEVISGFRVGFGGMAEKLQIAPDLVTYGKIIGGGLPVGAVAGKTSIMQHLAPLGNVYQAGTLSANPLAMVAGLATMQQLTPSFYGRLEKYAQEIAQIFTQWLQQNENPIYRQMQMVQSHSLFWFHPQRDDRAIIRRNSNIPSTLAAGFTPFFSDLLERGIYLAPNAYEVGFVSIAHNEEVQADLKARLWK